MCLTTTQRCRSTSQVLAKLVSAGNVAVVGRARVRLLIRLGMVIEFDDQLLSLIIEFNYHAVASFTVSRQRGRQFS